MLNCARVKYFHRCQRGEEKAIACLEFAKRHAGPLESGAVDAPSPALTLSGTFASG
jgi:hypothetical protein